jgi:hypothetical protein
MMAWTQGEVKEGVAIRNRRGLFAAGWSIQGDHVEVEGDWAIG